MESCLEDIGVSLSTMEARLDVKRCKNLSEGRDHDGGKVMRKKV